MRFTRVTVNPEQMGGVPCIRGLRIPVATVVAMVADGMTETEILSAYPDLERDDVAEALRYAAEVVRERELPLVDA
jgi:uncharacterized protein (DUF433 family)